MKTGLETRVLPFADNSGQLKGIVSFDSSFAELGAGWSYVLLFASKEFVALHSGPRLGRSERARHQRRKGGDRVEGRPDKHMGIHATDTARHATLFHSHSLCFYNDKV